MSVVTILSNTNVSEENMKHTSVIICSSLIIDLLNDAQKRINFVSCI